MTKLPRGSGSMNYSLITCGCSWWKLSRRTEVAGEEEPLQHPSS